jgi:hypothetical protein
LSRQSRQSSLLSEERFFRSACGCERNSSRHIF